MKILEIFNERLARKDKYVRIEQKDVYDVNLDAFNDPEEIKKVYESFWRKAPRYVVRKKIKGAYAYRAECYKDINRLVFNEMWRQIMTDVTENNKIYAFTGSKGKKLLYFGVMEIYKGIPVHAYIRRKIRVPLGEKKKWIMIVPVNEIYKKINRIYLVSLSVPKIKKLIQTIKTKYSWL